MNWTLTVRGALEDDPALQEIVSILYRKTATPETVAEVSVEEPAVDNGNTPAYTPVPKPSAPALCIDSADESPVPKPAVVDTELEAAVEEAVADAPEPQAAAVDFTTVSAAARKAINAKIPHEVLTHIFKTHGDPLLRNVPEAEYAAVLAEIEAL
ncbi:hypothetical protein [Gordonibacter sp.]|uniref:hypothetical protein n=1 Tax=Gordonibacter sp. TaxID=1968902 RepID=UPI002FC936F7